MLLHISSILLLNFFEDVQSQFGGNAGGYSGGNFGANVGANVGADVGLGVGVDANVGFNYNTDCKYNMGFNFNTGYNNNNNFGYNSNNKFGYNSNNNVGYNSNNKVGYNNFGYNGNFGYNPNCNNPNEFPIYTPDMPCNEELVYCSSQGEKILYDYETQNLTKEIKDFDPEVEGALWLHGSDPELEEPYKQEWIKALNERYNDRYFLQNILDCSYSKLVSRNFYEESFKNLPYVAKCIGEVVNAVHPSGVWVYGSENIGAILMTHLGDHFTRKKYRRALALDPACRLDGGKPELDLITAKDFTDIKDCYHACGNEYASKSGHVDFYMNIKYGSGQPGCPPDDMECSYKRTFEMLLESIRNRQFVFYAFKCNYINANFDYDCPDVNAYTGCGEPFNYVDSGQYALNTTDAPPLALGQYKNLEQLRKKDISGVYFLE